MLLAQDIPPLLASLFVGGYETLYSGRKSSHGCFPASICEGDTLEIVQSLSQQIHGLHPQAPKL